MKGLQQGKSKGKDEIGISMSNALPVTYSWENIEVFLDIPQGNCFSRMQNKTPPIQKRILDNGIINKIRNVIAIKMSLIIIYFKI
jgi:hypothetical protein